MTTVTRFIQSPRRLAGMDPQEAFAAFRASCWQKATAIKVFVIGRTSFERWRKTLVGTIPEGGTITRVVRKMPVETVQGAFRTSGASLVAKKLALRT